tara:strand:- start:557 stop:718 length:162 start_codon:yes stop_codon:yes gene_type:complete
MDTTMIAGYNNINDDSNKLDFHLINKTDKIEITLSMHMNDDIDKDEKINSERL